MPPLLAIPFFPFRNGPPGHAVGHPLDRIKDSRAGNDFPAMRCHRNHTARSPAPDIAFQTFCDEHPIRAATVRERLG